MARGSVKNVTPESERFDDKGSNRKQSKSRGRRGGVRRLIAIGAFLPIAGRAPLYARLVTALLVDPRMPASRKVLLAGAAGYLLLGRDIIPDEVPILGGLDDLVVVALAVDLFLDGVEDAILEEKLTELGISRVSYDEDMARIRRFLPGPIRRTIKRLPGALQVAGDAIQQSGFGPRLRTWLQRDQQEGSVA
jgi:uncharacterized membrane protein YkvA (DUF1232 family)